MPQLEQEKRTEEVSPETVYHPTNHNKAPSNSNYWRLGLTARLGLAWNRMESFVLVVPISSSNGDEYST